MDEGNNRHIRVLLVDASEFARSGLRALLEEDPAIAVVAGVAPTDAVAWAERLHPEVIIVDPETTSRFDIALVRGCQAAAPEAHLVIYTRTFTVESLVRLSAAGAISCLVKAQTPPAAVRLAVTAAALGVGTAAPALTPHIPGWASEWVELAGDEPLEPQLTPREREVADLLAQGKDAAGAGSALRLKRTTAEGHVLSFRHKLRAETGYQAGIRAAIALLGRPHPAEPGR